MLSIKSPKFLGDLIVDQPSFLLRIGALLDPKSSTPLITIGLTCFNAAATVGRAVTSALRQDWPTKEIIVVDDASKDMSSAILEKLASHHTEIRIIRHRINTGLSGALNTIIREARG